MQCMYLHWAPLRACSPLLKRNLPQTLPTNTCSTMCRQFASLSNTSNVPQSQATYAVWFHLWQDYTEGITKAIRQKTTDVCYICNDKMNSPTLLLTKQPQGHVHTPQIIQLSGHLTENKAKGQSTARWSILRGFPQFRETIQQKPT